MMPQARLRVRSETLKRMSTKPMLEAVHQQKGPLSVKYFFYDFAR